MCEVLPLFLQIMGGCVKWALFEMIKMVRNRVLFAISKALGFIFVRAKGLNEQQ